MKIQMDDKKYILEHINYKGSPYAGECTFVAGDDLGNRFENSTRITFNADFRLLMDSQIRALQSNIDRLADENEKLKKERPKHYEGYFRDVAATNDKEGLKNAAISMVSEKEYEIAELKKELDEERNKSRGLQAKINQFGKSTSDLKAEFIGEFYEMDDDGSPYGPIKRTVSWTLTKQIFKEMCEYVKNRKDEDIRP